MLKLTVTKEVGGGYLRERIIVGAGVHDPLVQVALPRKSQPNTWMLCSSSRRITGTPAASLLHALELGIAAVARRIAVEILKDPAPPTLDEKVEGVALWLRDNDPAPLTRLWIFSPEWKHAVCVPWGLVFERELARQIEHAAPWIAAALAKGTAS